MMDKIERYLNANAFWAFNDMKRKMMLFTVDNMGEDFAIKLIAANEEDTVENVRARIDLL